ncbi:MAG: hypothetical protein NVS3B2_04080 [Ramlibacter sp.]
MTVIRNSAVAQLRPCAGRAQPGPSEQRPAPHLPGSGCLKAAVIGLLAALAVTACGGGGDGGSARREGEGAYLGTISLGYAFEAYVLENGEFWAVYGKRTAEAFTPYGLVHGSGTPANGVLVSTDVKDFVYTGAIDTGRLDASYVASVSFKGAALLSGQALSFESTATPPAQFDYDQSPNLASFAGSWSGVTIYGQSGTLAITDAGMVSGTIGGCAVSGAVAARERGKNVLASKVQLSGTSCQTPFNGSGIAVVSRTAEGAPQLRVEALNSSASAALTFVAQR